MPAPIPDRFDLEMRLGRDGDIEEWLATDTSLDRPVLVRSLGPETSSARRREFVASVSAAAEVSHSHLAKVFAAAEVDGGAYSVSEWTGGSTVADRLAAGQPIELQDFLPNASGLAGALTALHDRNLVHGSIDPSAISYSVSHAAKLGGFGRPVQTDAIGDVKSLAMALETTLTGSPPGGPPPSESIDGLSRSIDRILRAGQSGEITASELEKALVAAPTPHSPEPEPRAMSRRLLISAIVLVALAVGLVALGRTFSGGSEPIIPPPITTIGIDETTTSGPSITAGGNVGVDNAASYDPFGEAGENDDLIPNLFDGSTTTSWSTETYQDPLNTVKEGVGITLTVHGTPSRVQLVGLTADTTFEIFWSETFLPQFDGWTHVAGAKAPPGLTVVDLPPRQDGFWLIWLTSLPAHPDATYRSALAEVRFLP